MKAISAKSVNSVKRERWRRAAMVEAIGSPTHKQEFERADEPDALPEMENQQLPDGRYSAEKRRQN